MEYNIKMECDYCDKKFETKVTLLRHLCLSKKCIQGNKDDVICIWCLGPFDDSNTDLKEHYKVCDENKEFLYNRALNYIRYYKEEINNLIEKLKDRDEENKKLKKELYDIILDTTSLFNPKISN
jgi:hypothetical protein